MKHLSIILFIIPLFTLAQKPRLVIRSGIQNIAMMASISPDNKLALTVDNKQELILWELSSGRQLETFRDIQAADFGLDNQTIDIVAPDRTFKTMDYSGKLISESTIKSNPVVEPWSYSYYRKSGLYLENGLIYTRDKGYLCRIVPEHYGTAQHYSEVLNLLSIPDDNIVQLCKVPTGEIVKVLKTNLVNKFPSIKKIKFTQFSPDGNYMLTGNDYSLEITDINSGDSLFSYSIPLKLLDYQKMNQVFINNATFSPDSKKLLVLGADVIKMFDLGSKKELWSVPQTEIKVPGEFETKRGMVHFSDDGTKALLGHFNKFLCVNTENGNVSSKLVGVTQSMTKYHQLKENVNGLFVEQGDNVVNWNLASSAVQNTTAVAEPLGWYPVQISSKGNRFYNFWQEINQQSGKSTELETVGEINNDAKQLSISFDDKYLLYIGDYNKKAYLASLNTDQLIVADLATKKIKWRKNEFNMASFAHKSNVVAAACNWYSSKKSIYLVSLRKRLIFSRSII